jgi:hypothetical protein
MSDNLLQKVVDTVLVNDSNQPGQGGLTYAQTDKFIDYMWDATVLGSLVRKRRMRAVEEEISVISVGARLMRGATEAVDTGENAVPAFAKLSITAKKFRLDWELSSESLEDNVEGAELEDHIARLMATQAGNDLEDIAINGDTASSVPGIDIIDGWRKRAVAGAHVVDHKGETLNRSAFNKALKAMPRKYMARRNGLRFFTGSNAIQDYIFSLQQVENGFVNPESLAAASLNSGVRTEGPAGFITGNAFGVPVQEVPLFDEARDGDYDTNSGTSGVQVPSTNLNHVDLWLTFPQNLIWGIKREITIHRQFMPKKDTIEYTVYVRQGVQIENLDAFVVVKNVRIAE